jgi:hypothetical protein
VYTAPLLALLALPSDALWGRRGANTGRRVDVVGDICRVGVVDTDDDDDEYAMYDGSTSGGPACGPDSIMSAPSKDMASPCRATPLDAFSTWPCSSAASARCAVGDGGGLGTTSASGYSDGWKTCAHDSSDAEELRPDIGPLDIMLVAADARQKVTPVSEIQPWSKPTPRLPQQPTNNTRPSDSTSSRTI